MSGTPITNLRTFYVNSYYCKYENTNNINYNLDVENDYLQLVNRVSVTKIYIPNKIFQFDPSDFFILEENGVQVTITLAYKTYDTYQALADDLEIMLTNNSPNMYVYTVIINPNTNNTMTITANDDTTSKKIIVTDKHLQLAYGMTEENIFMENDTLITGMITLSPIDMVFINSNAVSTYNTGNLSSSILAVYDLHEANQIMQQTDLLTGAKPFNQTKNLYFTLSDFDGELIELSANKHWWFELSLFTLNEDFIDKQKLFIDMQTIKTLKKVK